MFMQHWISVGSYLLNGNIYKQENNLGMVLLWDRDLSLSLS